jgi:hypothetical protein
MEAKEAHSIVKANLKNAEVFFPDATYARPMQSFLTGKFYTYFKGWLSENSLSTWNARFDCDNFATTYYTFAQICNKKGDRKEEAIAVGIMFFKQDSGGGHAINFAIVENKKFVTIEPQTGEVIALSQTEKDSCWFALL